MHTLHILKTFVVAREQFIFNTASYIIHSDWRDVSDQTVQYTVQYSTARVHSSFSSYEKELSEFHGCHHYRPVDGLNPDDWWRWGRRPRGRHSWAKPGAARAGATATPCNHYRAALGGQMTAQTHFNRYLNGRPTSCRKSGLRLHKKSLFKFQQCPAVGSLLSGFWRSSLYKLLPWLGRAVLPRHGRSNVTD